MEEKVQIRLIRCSECGCILGIEFYPIYTIDVDDIYCGDCFEHIYG